MALLEKKQGRRKLFFEIKQYGQVLSQKDWGEGDERLVGYMRFESEEIASQKKKKLLISRAIDGYKVSDEDAKACLLGHSFDKKEDTKICAPYRQDFHFYNEATGFTICSGKVLGAAIDDESAKWKKAVNDGHLIPVSLIQDDSFNIRVVLDDALSAAESDEWVGKIESHLNLEKGVLCMGAGAEHIYGDSDDAEEADDYLHKLRLSPGKYKATLYMYIPGINGTACLDEIAGGYDEHEPLLPWFRRSWGDDKVPLWLQNWCVGGSELDPENPKEFANVSYLSSEELPEMIDFLLHLETISESPKSNKFNLDSGWFPETEGARIPSKCPKGIEAVNLLKKEPKSEAGPLVYPRNVYELVSRNIPAPLDGGGIDLEFDEILNVLAFVSLTHPDSMLEMRISSSTHLPPIEWDESISNQIIQIAYSPVSIGIIFGGDLRPSKYIEELRKLLPALRKLTGGIQLELAFSNHWKSSDTTLAGTHRFQGKLENNHWHVESVFPPIAQAQLVKGIELGKQVLQSELPVSDSTEFEKIQSVALKAFPYHFDDNKPVLEGNKLRLEPFDRSIFQMLGQAAMKVRFPSVWRTNVGDLLEDENDSDFDLQN